MATKRIKSSNKSVRPFSRQNERGAVWLGETAAKQSYLTGYITVEGMKHKIVMFNNNNVIKPNDRQPDYRIFYCQFCSK